MPKAKTNVNSCIQMEADLICVVHNLRQLHSVYCDTGTTIQSYIPLANDFETPRATWLLFKETITLFQLHLVDF